MWRPGTGMGIRSFPVLPCVSMPPWAASGTLVWDPPGDWRVKGACRSICTQAHTCWLNEPTQARFDSTVQHRHTGVLGLCCAAWCTRVPTCKWFRALGAPVQVLSCATTETDNPDLRDRAYIYWRLLSTDPEVLGCRCACCVCCTVGLALQQRAGALPHACGRAVSVCLFHLSLCMRACVLASCGQFACPCVQ